MRYSKRMDSINIVPFIDIMLVLLVIVLTSATFIAQGKIPITIPKAQGSETTKEELKSVEITINAQGEYFLDKNQASLEAIKEVLLEMSKDTPILLRGDQKSYFEKFIALVGMLNEIGRVNVDIQVEQIQ
ncbi:MAG: biopolymer transporter ExbD [Helicobacter sp.]|uniref:biopolymer transporter ExbD n=1 Tax=Helicobacter TaxID=209 RepID=UPI00202A3BAD|nr:MULTISPECIES: biopolymer transporter ExbD [Helicobacter]MCI7765614.1 biopolymer transporter ExbD [Helicobacter sp.]MCL9822237.1 biopolymer transporter ExbD [Helicobacter colisuis]MDY4426470.1 biopolymer transporter ExbD [Helicobacter sp.]